jgi:hypothetical protein
VAGQIGNVTKPYISSVDMLDDREIYPEVLDLWKEEATVLDILEITGRTKKTAVPTYNHFENQMKYQAVQIAASGVAGTNGAGNTATVTLASGSHTSSGTNSFPKVTEFVKTKSGVVGYISAKSTAVDSAHTVTIKPIDASTNIVGALADADYITTFSNGQAEGSNSPDGRRYTLDKKANRIQIFKDKYGITDLQRGSKISVKFKGKPYWMFKAQPDLFSKFRMDIMFQFLIGRGSSTLTDAGSALIYATDSLEEYTLDSGYEHPLSTTITKTDWKNINKQLDRERGPDEYWGWFGTSLHQDIDDLFTTMEGLKAGGVVYSSFNGLSKERVIKLGIDSFKLYGRTIHSKKIPAFDHKEVTSATGFNYREEGFLLPTDSQKMEYGAGGSADRICVRWLPVSGKKYLETQTGKYASQGATDDESKLYIHYEAHLGLEVFGAKDFVKISYSG